MRPKKGDTSPPALRRGFFDGYPEDVDPVLGMLSVLLCSTAMGTGNSHTDANTEWLELGLIAAYQGADALRALWERLASVGKLPHDIDISDPDAVDWERITDVLVAMEAFERWVTRLSELPADGLWGRDETGQFVEVPVPLETPPVH